jgi:hypothetical protein
MLTAPFNPRAEQDALSGAVSRFQEQWDKAPHIQTVLDLCDAAERADEVLRTLEAQESLDQDTRLQVLQLKILQMTAKQTLEAVQDEPLRSATLYSLSEEQFPTPDTIFPAGTILDCSQCGEGLYKVTQEVSTAGIVLDEGACPHTPQPDDSRP